MLIYAGDGPVDYCSRGAVSFSIRLRSISGVKSGVVPFPANDDCNFGAVVWVFGNTSTGTPNLGEFRLIDLFPLRIRNTITEVEDFVWEFFRWIIGTVKLEALDDLAFQVLNHLGIGLAYHTMKGGGGGGGGD